VNTITITLNYLSKTIKAEIDSFFERVLNYEYTVSKQAYLEARSKLNVEAFSKLYETTVNVAAEDLPEYKTWQGLRVGAIDGTTLTLEDTESLRGYFGVSGGENGVATARASTLTDVLNSGLTIDAQIAKYSTGERDLALLHHQKLMELGVADKFVILYDRGYISEEMIRDLTQKGIKFVFRVKRRQYPLIDSINAIDAWIDLRIKKNTYRVRVIKIMLNTGEEEILVTNLSTKKYGYTSFKELYSLRWGILSASFCYAHLFLRNLDLTGNSNGSVIKRCA